MRTVGAVATTGVIDPVVLLGVDVEVGHVVGPAVAGAGQHRLGVSYGAVAGYYGGHADEVMMRFVDFLYGLPYMFIVILIMLLFSETARGDPG